jgi:hypothetical protein
MQSLNLRLFVVMSLALVAFAAELQAQNLGKVQSLSLSPKAVISGRAVTGTVHLDRTAFPESVRVGLSTDNAAARVSASVTVPVGASSATFEVTTLGVAADTAVEVRAAGGGGSATASFMIIPPGLKALTLGATQVAGGRSFSATVSLTGPAPDGGFNVALSDEGRANAPSSVSVPGGQTQATFTVTTTNVRAPETSTITAGEGTTAKTATITLLPLAIESISMVRPLVSQAQPGVATVKLNAPVTATGFSFAVSIDPSSAASAPNEVAVSTGPDSRPVAISARPVVSNTPATITIEANGVQRSASFTVMPPAVQSVSLAPPDRLSFPGGSAVNVIVQLDGDAPRGYTVTLSSSSSLATVPAALDPAESFVRQTSNRGRAPLQTTPVSTETNIEVKADGGGKTASVRFTLIPPSADLITCGGRAEASVVGGEKVTDCRVRLNGPAPSGGTKVALKSSSSDVFFDEQVAIREGQTESDSFSIGTRPVTVQTTATVSAGPRQVRITLRPSS